MGREFAPHDLKGKIMTAGSLDKATKPELEAMGKKLGIASAATLSKKDLITQIEKLKAQKVDKKAKVEEKPKVAEKPAKVDEKAKPAKPAAAPAPATSASKVTPAAPAAKPAAPAPAKPGKSAPAAAAPAPTAAPAKSDKKDKAEKVEKTEKSEKSESKAAEKGGHHGSHNVEKALPKAEKVDHEAHKPVAKSDHKEHKADAKGDHKGDSKAEIKLPDAKQVEPKPVADSISLVIRDSYWLHCHWNFAERSHQQAEIALGMDWAGAKLVLRLLDSTRGDHGRQAGLVVREIALPKSASGWYLETGGPGRKLHVEVGYKTLENKFFSLAQTSGIVTPHPGSVRPNQEAGGLPIDGATALAASLGSIAMSGEARGFLEERMRKPISSTPTAGIPGGSGTGKLQLNVEVEVHVTGTTAPNARVLVRGEPVRLKPEGTFFTKLKLADGRLMLPATAVSSDGREEKTVILVIERHTRYLDPSDRDVPEE